MLARKRSNQENEAPILAQHNLNFDHSKRTSLILDTQTQKKLQQQLELSRKAEKKIILASEEKKPRPLSAISGYRNSFHALEPIQALRQVSGWATDAADVQDKARKHESWVIEADPSQSPSLASSTSCADLSQLKMNNSMVMDEEGSSLSASTSSSSTQSNHHASHQARWSLIEPSAIPPRIPSPTVARHSYSRSYSHGSMYHQRELSFDYQDQIPQRKASDSSSFQELSTRQDPNRSIQPQWTSRQSRNVTNATMAWDPLEDQPTMIRYPDMHTRHRSLSPSSTSISSLNHVFSQTDRKHMSILKTWDVKTNFILPNTPDSFNTQFDNSQEPIVYDTSPDTPATMASSQFESNIFPPFDATCRLSMQLLPMTKSIQDFENLGMISASNTSDSLSKEQMNVQPRETMPQIQVQAASPREGSTRTHYIRHKTMTSVTPLLSATATDKSVMHPWTVIQPQAHQIQRSICYPEWYEPNDNVFLKPSWKEWCMSFLQSKSSRGGRHELGDFCLGAQRQAPASTSSQQSEWKWLHMTPSHGNSAPVSPTLSANSSWDGDTLCSNKSSLYWDSTRLKADDIYQKYFKRPLALQHLSDVEMQQRTWVGSTARTNAQARHGRNMRAWTGRWLPLTLAFLVGIAILVGFIMALVAVMKAW